MKNPNFAIAKTNANDKFVLKTPTCRGKYFYKKVKIIPSKFCNNAKFFPRPKDPKVQKSSNVEKVFTENI